MVRLLKMSKYCRMEALQIWDTTTVGGRKLRLALSLAGDTVTKLKWKGVKKRNDRTGLASFGYLYDL